MMAVLVGHHVLLGQRPTAGTELVLEHIEESVSKYAVWSPGQ